MGRDYNSKEINDVTSTRIGGEADPSRTTDAYEKLKKPVCLMMAFKWKKCKNIENL